MDTLYESLFSGSSLLSEQFMRHLRDLSSPDGPVLLYVGAGRQVQATDPARAAFLQDETDRLGAICDQIDDGDDPCVCAVEGGCVVGTQLATERTHCGYFLLYLEGYAAETVQVNLDVFELVLMQAQCVCQLLEKNNQLHHLRLAHLSKTSTVLG